MAAKVWRGLAWWDELFWRVVAPALALFILVLGAVDLPSSLQAAENKGQPGTFTAQRSECGRYGCTFHGTFVSEDGAVRLADVFIDNGVDEVGESVPAQYVEDERAKKVYEANSRDRCGSDSSSSGRCCISSGGAGSWHALDTSTSRLISRPR